MGLFDKLLGGKKKACFDREIVTIVSGLPRSGTSMMMKMLEAGGIPVVTDNLRTADEDNPKGYYELERVKQLPKGDTAWLENAKGKVVKVISALLEHLPAGYTYRVVFMHRAIPEILASQRRMLAHRGEPADRVSDEKMAQLYQKHLRQVKGWLSRQPNMTVLYVSYNDLLHEPAEQVAQVNRFFGNCLDEEKMLAAIDPNLYRQRQEKLQAATTAQ